MRATRAIIHLDNLRDNIGAARKLAGPHPKICVPVKADAYGHGAVAVSRSALAAGAEYLAVATVSEGEELRAAGIDAPVLLLSPALPEELPAIVELDLVLLVSDAEFIAAAAAAAEQAKKRLTVHLKIDTGMGRVGCRSEEALSLAALIASRRRLVLGGVATHLAVSDSPASADIAYTREQLRRFRETLEKLKSAGVDTGLVHAANSGALVSHGDSFFDMIRPGLFLYGYSPDGKRGIVKPVMELRSTVVAIKKVKKGEAVSYGRTWTAPEDTLIGVIPAGYADGFPRGLSNNHSIGVRGKAYPLAGRICMDLSMINLGNDTEVRRWDEAVIFGPDFITAAEMAEKLDTIPYEITCNINKRVPREYLGLV